MIRERTLLVLGAGASMPYGFPLGPDLVEKIVTDFAGNKSNAEGVLQELGHSGEEIRRFQNELSLSKRDSIDEFLEHRSEWRELGKAALSTVIMLYERDEGLRRVGGDWYRYLWKALNTPPDRMAENRLQVITFNYDRSLERYLYIAYKNSYGLSESEALKIQEFIRIDHVYGSLGSLDPSNQAHIPYDIGPHFNRNVIEGAKSNIRIIHESREDPGLASMRQAFRAAQKICFLGFGFHPENMRRLADVDQLLKADIIMGTAKGFSINEKKALVGRLGFGIKLGDSAQGCLDYLKESAFLGY